KHDAENVLEMAQNKARNINSEAEAVKRHSDEILQKAQITLREAELKRETQDQREKELEDRELAVIVKELQYYSPIKK
ncbi:MAG: hypothetical protein KGL39_34625, partial [Patescibacteria group bacterium]|nr:hypothetical protein [Patescibacteria group bacterium]